MKVMLTLLIILMALAWSIKANYYSAKEKIDILDYIRTHTKYLFTEDSETFMSFDDIVTKSRG